MKIDKALPIARYVKAAEHARSAKFLALRDRTIAMLQSWWQDDRINLELPPALWFGYGKDGMAVSLLLKLAGVKFTLLTINNGGDVAGHELVYPEYDRFIGTDQRIERYVPAKRYMDAIYDGLAWGRIYGFKKKSGELIDFFDWGAMGDTIAYETNTRFYFQYGGTTPFLLRMWGNRAGEGMDRAFEIKTRGMLSLWDDKEDTIPQFRGLPIGDWKDIDVWALLISEDCPVSPIYAMHQIPQRTGRGSFPRTVWYCSPHILSSTFYKWMARYSPAQLKEMTTMFPEIMERITMQEASANAERP